MTNIYFLSLTAARMLFSLSSTGAKSSPSGGTINRKLAPAPRPFPSQIKLRFKIVANATGLPGGRITERKEPKASWWDKTPGQHTKAYIASFFPPGPNRQIEAQIVMHKVSIFWLTCVPVVSIFSIWLPTASGSFERLTHLFYTNGTFLAVGMALSRAPYWVHTGIFRSRDHSICCLVF